MLRRMTKRLGRNFESILLSTFLLQIDPIRHRGGTIYLISGTKTFYFIDFFILIET